MVSSITENNNANELKFVYLIEEEGKRNKILVDKLHKNEIEIIKSLLDIQNKLAVEYFWILQSGFVKRKSTDISVQAFVNNLYSLYSAYHLTVLGAYKPARQILRHSFEFLVLAKYCYITSSDELIKSWDNGEDISLRNHVLNKIKKPDTSDFISFWRFLCKFSHATVYSGQPEIKLSEETEFEIQLNFAFIRILLECNYHLLNTYILKSSIKFHAEHYGPKRDIRKVKRREIRKKANELMSINKKDMMPDSKKLIYNYKLKWIIR